MGLGGRNAKYQLKTKGAWVGSKYKLRNNPKGGGETESKGGGGKSSPWHPLMCLTSSIS